MTANGEVNSKFGVYRGLCCRAEIVINAGSTFPDCPNHPKLTTMWKPVLDETITSLVERTHNPIRPPKGTLRTAVCSMWPLDGSNWRNGTKTIYIAAKFARAFSMFSSTSRSVHRLKTNENQPR